MIASDFHIGLFQIRGDIIYRFSIDEKGKSFEYISLTQPEFDSKMDLEELTLGSPIPRDASIVVWIEIAKMIFPRLSKENCILKINLFFDKVQEINPRMKRPG